MAACADGRQRHVRGEVRAHDPDPRADAGAAPVRLPRDRPRRRAGRLRRPWDARHVHHGKAGAGRRSAPAAGERGYAVGVATNLRQARLLVAAARSVVERSPLLAPLVESSTDDEIVFRNGSVFAAFPCTSRGGRGWPVFCLLMDEAAHFVDTEGNASAEPVFRALVPATAQFGGLARVVVSSTPWGADGFFADLYQRAASGELEDAYAHHASTGEANPAIDRGFLAAEERRDPESFRSEYLAEFVGSGGAFFRSGQRGGGRDAAGRAAARGRDALGGGSRPGVLVRPVRADARRPRSA